VSGPGLFGGTTFWVDYPAMVGISGLTISNGPTGILNFGTLTLSSSAVSDNQDSGIINDNTLTVSDCTVSNNAGLNGGGIDNLHNATVNNTTIANNSAHHSDVDGNGGGIANEEAGHLTITNSTISGNTAYGHCDGYCIARGGGIWIDDGYLLLTNSTITGNVADRTHGEGYGGGVYEGFYADSITIESSTITGNTGFTDVSLGAGTCITGNSIVGSLSGSITSGDHNLINVNPLLGPLQDNGGPTQTMALLASSPALNAGDPAQLGVPDQRGVVRSGGVNIGAYQASASAFVLTAPATIRAGRPFDVTVKAVDIFGQTALGYTGTVTFSTTDPDPGVVLPPDYTFTASDQGTHTFSGGFTLMTPGDEMLTATDSASGFSASTVVTVQGAGPAPGRHRTTDSMDALFAVLVAESSRPGSPNGALALWDGLFAVS
jgi:hypothetical protein